MGPEVSSLEETAAVDTLLQTPLRGCWLLWLMLQSPLNSDNQPEVHQCFNAAGTTAMHSAAALELLN